MSTFEWNEAGYRQMIQSDVVRDLIRRAVNVTNSARHHATCRPGPNVITGRLRDSITWKLGRDFLSPYVDIGTNVYYAAFVELGHNNTAHAYPIYTPGGTFTGEFGYVSDKPTPPYPFLRPALEAARI